MHSSPCRVQHVFLPVYCDHVRENVALTEGFGLGLRVRYLGHLSGLLPLNYVEAVGSVGSRTGAARGRVNIDGGHNYFPQAAGAVVVVIREVISPIFVNFPGHGFVGQRYFGDRLLGASGSYGHVKGTEDLAVIIVNVSAHHLATGGG